MNTDIRIIQTTLPDTWIEAEVGAFAQTLLEAGAACVQHSTIQSTFKWEGAIESSAEWRIQMKVSESNFDTVLATLGEIHPYEIPQIIHWVAESTQEYAEWVDSD